MPKSFRALLVIAGLCSPFALILSTDIYHRFDVPYFVRWAQCWNRWAGAIYLQCERPVTYPFLGVLSTAGVISALKSVLPPDLTILAYRCFLACFDAANFVLVAIMAGMLRLKRPWLVSLLILLLPATWAGGALWGQIDGISQFSLLLSIVCFVASLTMPTTRTSGAMFLAGLVAVAAAVLMKQVTVFSLPGLLLLASVAAARLSLRDRAVGMSGAIAAVAIAALLFRFLDTRLAVPPGYFDSSYGFSWTIATEGEPVISNNGFNIWVLFNRPMSASANDPLYCVSNNLCVTPYAAGITLFASYLLALVVLYGSLIVSTLRRVGLANGSVVCVAAAVILFIAQANLGANVLLANTNERYLYHFYPFVIVAGMFFAGQRTPTSRVAMWFSGGGALAYGTFVYGVLTRNLPWFLLPLAQHQLLATIHLELLLYLLYFSFFPLRRVLLSTTDPVTVN